MMEYESLSADMSGEKIVVVRVVGDEFVLIRKTVDGEQEEQLTRLNKREAMFLPEQLEDAVLNHERGGTE